jgi:hypothetical protein
MEKRIIYQIDGGGVAVVIPAPDCGLTVEQIAAKDVPAGRNWRIVNADDLPSRDTRDQWRWTDSGPLAVDPLPAQT